MYTPLSLVILDFETQIKNNKHYIIKTGILVETPERQTLKIYSFTRDLHIYMEDVLNDIIRFSSSKGKIILYSHNLSKFDGPLLLKFFIRSSTIKIRKLLNVDNKIVFLEIEFKNRVFILKDSLRLFPKSLKKLSRLFVTIDKDKLPINPRLICTPPKILNSYLRKDLKIVKTFLKKFNLILDKNYDLCVYDYLGIPTLGISLLKKFSNNQSFKIPNKRIKKFIRRSYKGGILFSKAGKSGPITHYDINSLYAFSMLNKQPWGRPRLSRSLEMSDMFGFVQIRDLKVVKGLNFINENRTHYFSEELKFMKSLGISFSIVKSYQFNYSYKILNKFSNSFYRNKQENVNFPETLSKVILNSTYGKLGVKQNLDLTPITQNTQNMYTPNFLRNIPNHNQPIENNLTSVALASSISAYSRITMSQYLFSKDMKINYVNTDSLISGSSIKKFPVNDILGSFKKSTPIYYDRGVYINLKSFILSNFKSRSSKIKGTMFGQEENLEYLLYSTYQNFYEPRWYSEQTNIFTQTRKIRFGLTFNPKAIRRK